MFNADGKQTNTQITYIKNYKFNYDFGGAWGNCNVVFTCVSGHMTEAKFGADIEKGDWHNPNPKVLFTAPVTVAVGEVFSRRASHSDSV